LIFAAIVSITAEIEDGTEEDEWIALQKSGAHVK